MIGGGDRNDVQLRTFIIAIRQKSDKGDTGQGSRTMIRGQDDDVHQRKAIIDRWISKIRSINHQSNGGHYDQ